MNTEEKVELLGEKLTELNDRVNKLCAVLRVVNQFHRDSKRLHDSDIDAILKWGDDCIDWLEGNLNVVDYKYRDILQMRNELTYLHNEVNEIKENLGMDGSVPVIKPKRKSKYD